jgi:DegV family protein with EDD domain
LTRIVVDSTCDLPSEQMADLDIVMVPLKVHFGDEVYRDKLDLDEETFFTRLEVATKLPTTSQPSPGEFQAAYEGIPAGEEIVSIHIASQLSGTFQSATLAASALPDRRIHVVDSGSVSWGAGLMVIEAAKAIKAGKSADEVVAMLEQLKPRVRLLAILDTLKYVIMGGRVSKAQGMIGGLLRVKALLLIVGGEIHRLPPARTWGQAYEKVIEDIGQNGGPEHIAVIQARAAEAAAAMRAKLATAYPGVEVEAGTIGPVVGTHAGPGAAGVAYIARQG